MNLAELQGAFFAHISRTAEVPEGFEREIRAFGALSPGERLDLYANMYFIRLVEALREDFPHLAAMLGEAFEPLVSDYVRAHPSTNASLAHLGAKLPAFLASVHAEPPTASPSPVHPEPRHEVPKSNGQALSELACLEWARSEVLCEVDATPVGPEAMRGEVLERFAEARLEPIPALRVLSFTHDVVSVWRALEHGANRRPDAECRGRVGEAAGANARAEGAEQERPAFPFRETHAVVWRKGFDVFHAEVAPEEASALRDALAGKTASELCERFGAAEDPAAAAFGAIGSWLSEGMIRAVELP